MMMKFIKKFLREVNQKGILIEIFQDKRIFLITSKKCKKLNTYYDFYIFVKG